MGLVEFVLSPPDIVRSADQLWLLNRWIRARGSRQLPAVEGVPAEEPAGISDNLLFTDVVSREGATRFLIRSGGRRITEYFGVSCPTGGQGRFLDEVLPRPIATPRYRPSMRPWRRASRSTPSRICAIAADASFISSDCCCRSAATARRSIGSWPRSKPSVRRGPSTVGT